MKTYTKKEVLQFKAELKRLNDAHNALIAKTNAVEEINHAVFTLKKHNINVRSLVVPALPSTTLQESYAKLEAREKEIVALLLDSNYSDVVCNRTVTFYVQENCRSFKTNHDVDIVLKNKFPQGVADSESEQGFFYINEKYADDVVSLLEMEGVTLPESYDNLFGEFPTPIFNWD